MINGTSEERTVAFDPAVIGATGRTAIRICDGNDKRSYAIDEIILDGVVELSMLGEGGCTLRID